MISDNITVDNYKSNFKSYSEKLFASLLSGEHVTLNLASEISNYVRFNQSKIRQSTDVNQGVITLTFQKDKRKIVQGFSYTFRLEEDLNRADEILKSLRQSISGLKEDPHLVEMKNHGQSDHDYLGSYQNDLGLMESLLKPLSRVDLAGIYTSGYMIRANSNNFGQFHWFSTKTFSMDYSIYSEKQQSVKGMYAGNSFNHDDYLREIEQAKMQLDLMKKPSKKLSPGKYKVYMAPSAVAEILGTMNWGGFSMSAYKQGRCPLRELADGKLSLANDFSLREDFTTGMAPQFNSLGEVADEKRDFILNGELKNLATSSRTAKEYNVPSTFADPFEGFRSPTLKEGNVNEEKVLSELGDGIYISNLHYLNWSDPDKGRITGMTRFACYLVENGKPVGPIDDMRFDDTVYNFFGKELVGVTDKLHTMPQTGTYGQRGVGGYVVPGVIVDNFSLTL